MWKKLNSVLVANSCAFYGMRWICCRMFVDVSAGLMYFQLFKSAQLVDAYKEANRIVVSCVFSIK